MENESPRKVLIVEDEQLIRYSLRSALQDGDTEVTAVADGEAALHASSSRCFEWCFLDLHLPDMDGFQIMDFIKRKCPDTKIVLMTGSQVNSSDMKIIERDAYLFLTKPFDLLLLKKMIDSVSAEDCNVFHDSGLEEHRLIEPRKKHQPRAETKPVPDGTPRGPERSP